jgi:uncharacterized protein (DUF2384 family)
VSADTDFPPRPKRRDFSKRYGETLLSPERAERQWRIVGLAYGLLGDRDAAMSFLNTANTSLGARPLDLAMSDAAGYATVERVIRLLAHSTLGRLQ